MEFNLVLTSQEKEEWLLKSQLEDLGEFRTTEFRSLLLGEVECVRDFLEQVSEKEPFSLSRVIPVQENLHLKPSELVDIFKERIGSYEAKIDRDDTFAVRFERRGFKDQVSSQSVEHEVGGYLYDLLESNEKEPEVDLEDPDVLITFQGIGNFCGLGMIKKETRHRFPFVRVK